MNSKHDKMVLDVIKGINWQRVKYFHSCFDIKWQFEEKEGHIMERYPTISELKEELRSLLKFVIERNARSLDYSNWIIFWTDEEAAKNEGLSGARLEAIFSLEETFVLDNMTEENNNEALIQAKLKEAIDKEQYEKAAQFRDKLKIMAEKKQK